MLGINSQFTINSQPVVRTENSLQLRIPFKWLDCAVLEAARSQAARAHQDVRQHVHNRMSGSTPGCPDEQDVLLPYGCPVTVRTREKCHANFGANDVVVIFSKIEMLRVCKFIPLLATSVSTWHVESLKWGPSACYWPLFLQKTTASRGCFCEGRCRDLCLALNSASPPLPGLGPWPLSMHIDGHGHKTYISLCRKLMSLQFLRAQLIEHLKRM
jgi:hypothetical protein